jgi:hypothetical protein
MESNLHPLSVINLIIKYADDTNLIVPKILILNWKTQKGAIINKMFINEAKSKELIFHKPYLHRFHVLM